MGTLSHTLLQSATGRPAPIAKCLGIPGTGFALSPGLGPGAEIFSRDVARRWRDFPGFLRASHPTGLLPGVICLPQARGKGGETSPPRGSGGGGMVPAALASGWEARPADHRGRRTTPLSRKLQSPEDMGEPPIRRTRMTTATGQAKALPGFWRARHLAEAGPAPGGACAGGQPARLGWHDRAVQRCQSAGLPKGGARVAQRTSMISGNWSATRIQRVTGLSAAPPSGMPAMAM
jgi:hypothetical protein